MADVRDGARRAATEREVSLSQALIVGALTVILILLWQVVEVFENISPEAKIYLMACSILSALLLVLSIISGGRGIAYGATPKSSLNAFNLQVIFSLSAFIISCAAVIVTFYNWIDQEAQLLQRIDETRSSIVNDIEAVQNEIRVTTNSSGARLNLLNQRLNNIENQLGRSERELERREQIDDAFDRRLQSISENVREILLRIQSSE